MKIASSANAARPNAISARFRQPALLECQAQQRPDEQRRQKDREGAPEHEGARSGAAGERNRHQPEIGNEDRQRAYDQEAVKQQVLGHPPALRPGGEFRPSWPRRAQ